MNKLTTSKRIWSLFLTLAMVLTMSVTTLPVYADNGGVIKVVYNPSTIPQGTETTFHLYEVGTFQHYTEGDNAGKSYIDLNDAFDGVGIDTSVFFDGQNMQDVVNGIDPKDAQWQAKWLDAAKCLAHFVNYPAKESAAPKSIADPVLKVQEAAQNAGDAKRHVGIYLLTGDPVKVGNYWWTPVPVLIQVINGDSTFTIGDVKMESTPVVYKHSVTKSWAGEPEIYKKDDKTPVVRPDSIRVAIYYGEGADSRLDVVTLSADNSWTYTWYSKEEDIKDGDTTKHQMTYTSIDPDAEPVETQILNPDNNYTYTAETKQKKWGVSELRESESDIQNLKYYTTSDPVVVSTETEEHFTITNTYNQADLTINKDLQSYLNQGTGTNATVVFNIVGTIGDVTVYENSVGMTFTGPGQQAITLTNIPPELDDLTVTEVYNTNYNLVNTPELTCTTDDQEKKHYTISFENKYTEGPPTYSTGVVNVYGSDGKYTPKTDTSGDYVPQNTEQAEPTPVEP